MKGKVFLVALGIIAICLTVQTSVCAFEGMGLGARIPSGPAILLKIWLSPSFAVEPCGDYTRRE